MAKKSGNIFYIAIVIFLTLLLSFVLLVPKKTRESFQTISGVTSIDIYKNTNTSAEFLSEYGRQSRLGLIDDRDKLLHMRGCYQLPTDQVNIIQELVSLTTASNARVSRLGPVFTNNFGEIEERIRENIKSTCEDLRAYVKNPSASLEGDIYVMIFQAPFYQSQDGSMMSVQFNIEGYGMMPINIAGTGDLSTLREKPLDFDVFIAYSKYRRNMSLRGTPLQLDTMLASYRTKHEQCFLKCQGAPGYVCGCKTGNTPQQNYKSNCVTSRLGASTIEERNEATPHNFPILYVVNPAVPALQGYVTVG